MERNLKELIREVLEKGYLMTLATADEGGVWAADVIYVHDDDFALYWMSDPECRHSSAIAKNKDVAGTVTVNGAGEENLGIQFSGAAERIEGNRHDLALKHFAKRNKPAPAESDDILQGDSWYVLKPKKIDLICERLYGFEKKRWS